MNKKRFPGEIRFDKPITLVFGRERFLVPIPCSLFMFQAAVEVEADEYASGVVAMPRTPSLDRWALKVGDAILLVTRRADGGPDHSRIEWTEPERDYTLELAPQYTRTRRGFRERLTPCIG